MTPITIIYVINGCCKREKDLLRCKKELSQEYKSSDIVEIVKDLTCNCPTTIRKNTHSNYIQFFEHVRNNIPTYMESGHLDPLRTFKTKKMYEAWYDYCIENKIKTDGERKFARHVKMCHYIENVRVGSELKYMI